MNEIETILADLEPTNKQDKVEYDIDKNLGFWLRAMRQRKHLMLADVSLQTGISQMRLLELEQGKAKVGIKKKECEKIAKLYLLPSELVITKAQGKEIN